MLRVFRTKRRRKNNHHQMPPQPPRTKQRKNPDLRTKPAKTGGRRKIETELRPRPGRLLPMDVGPRRSSLFRLLPKTMEFRNRKRTTRPVSPLPKPKGFITFARTKNPARSHYRDRSRTRTAHPR